MFLHLPKKNALVRKFKLFSVSVISLLLMLVTNDVKAQDPVSGTFTIDASQPSAGTNFQTFTEAVFSLAFGVNGPVVFNVAPGSGPYVEQININAVPGASEINTITFNGNGATLENTSTNSVARAVLKLDGARHIILNNIIFHAINDATEGSYGWGVGIVRDADSNTIKNCTINIDVPNPSRPQNTIGIYMGSSDDFPDNNGISNCDYNIIDNNTIKGGYDGIDMNNFAGNFGFDFTSMDFNQVTNNHISNFVHSGIHIMWNKGLLVKGNDITVNAFQSVHGIYIEERNNNLKIDGNRIHNFVAVPGSTDNNFCGIEIVNCLSSPSALNTISNNVIYDIHMLKDEDGITVNGASYVNVYHNTVVLDAVDTTGNTTSGFRYDGANFNVNFKNNSINVLRQGVGTGYGIYATAATNAFACDYNDIYTVSPNKFARNISNSYTSLDLWQTATARDIHSTSQDPLFTDLAGGNLKPTSVSLDNLGTPVPVGNDFNGDVRNNNTPDIGAYEFLTPPCNTPVIAGASVAIPSAAACGGGTRTLNLSGNSFGSGQTYQWQSSTTVNGTYTNVSGSLVVPLFDVAPTTDLYYRAVIGCGPGTGTSVPVLIAVRHALSGTYTINSAAPTDAANFTSFADLQAALECAGVAGPVVLNVAAGSGPYNDQLVLGSIAGSSATNTIRINGNGATLTYLALNTNVRGLIKLNGTKYVTIDNLVITGTGTTSNQYAYGVQLLNDADYNTISNCKINLSTLGTLTSPNYAGIIIGGGDADPISGSATNGDYNLIANNTITGGYYGIIVYSDPTPALGLPRATNDTIRNNIVTEQHAYGIYLKGTDRSSVEGNEVTRPARTGIASSYYGIYLNGVNTALAVNKNKIHTTHSGVPNDTNNPIAIYSNACDATSAVPNMISNNVIYDFGALGSPIGIENNSSDYTIYYHNTISFDRKVGTPAASKTTRAFYQTGTATGLIFKNNNITITRSGAATHTAIYLGTAGTGITATNNNYYVAGSGVNTIGFKTSAYTTLAAWQTGSGIDAGSLDLDPTYANLAGGDLSPTNLAMDNKGVFAGITTDINGLVRSATTPDIGAYEFTGILPVKLLNISATKVANDVIVKWTTSSELNTKHFVVERSTDAVSFSQAGIVLAHGNSSVNQNYNFTDANAALTAAKTLYYRLKIVDLDGHVEYSPVLAVQLGNEERVSINIQPNPFVSELYGKIISTTAGKANIRITDVAGRLISRQVAQVASGTNLISIERVSQLQKGVYIVTIEINNNTYVQRVIK